MVEEIAFIINKCPVGVFIFNSKMDIIDRNKKPRWFSIGLSYLRR
jgi:hypothetical protein